MHSYFLFPILLGGLAFPGLVLATDAPAKPAPTAPPAAVSAPTTPSVVPDKGFDPSRYETLWTKSPFSVATPDEGTESADYMLATVSQYDGVYYVGLMDKQSPEHFIVATGKPTRGLSLVSVTPGRTPSDTSVTLLKDGQTITLKFQQNPAQGVVTNNNPNPMPLPNGAMQPGVQPNVVPMPGRMPPESFNRPEGQVPPQFQRRHFLTIPPPPPGQTNQPPASRPGPG